MSPDPSVDLELLKTRVRSEEGWRSNVYDDETGRPIVPGSKVVGHPTIGYGFALDVRPLPRDVGESWLSCNVREVDLALQRRVPFWSELDGVRRLALAEMAYQMGVDGLMAFRLMIQALHAGDAETAARQALSSEWARQTPSRALRVANMLRTGKMPGEA